MSKKLISLVIPAFNEEGNILSLYQTVSKAVPDKYLVEFLFVDDGSNDHTLEVIKKLASKTEKVKYISLTRNFGHQYALKSGLDKALGDAVISMDADGQHPANLIPKLIKAWEQGYKIVYTRRVGLVKKSIFKNISSSFFYKAINLLSKTKIDPGSADFRLLDKEVVEFIKNSTESTLFLRGLVVWSGYSSYPIDYKPENRVWGKSKYSLSMMLRLAVDAITSFSIVPLRLATVFGFLMAFLSGLYALYALVAWINGWDVIVGWPSVIISVLFIGGLQLMMLGIIGEYIGKIFMETKNRPLYIIKEKKL